MLPINYPNDLTAFNNAYIIGLTGILNDALNVILAQVTHTNGSPVTWQSLLITPFEELEAINTQINLLGQNDRDQLLPLTDYTTLQPAIASFFMEQHELILATCFYCNIDTIFTFSEIGDYKDGLDFIRRADIYQLQLITGIGLGTAERIIEARTLNQFTSVDDFPVSEKIKQRIVNFKRTVTHNHFTLDHFYHKSAFKYLSLCLYNFVPSCYACNSKLKGVGNLYVTNPHFSSPSATTYQFPQDTCFTIFYHKEQNIVTQLEDFSVQIGISANKNSHEKYLAQLKIRGRYFHYKKEALRLIGLRKEYPETKLIELATETGLPIEELKKMIFGEELFEASYDQSSLTKYKRDIAANLDILK